MSLYIGNKRFVPSIFGGSVGSNVLAKDWITGKSSASELTQLDLNEITSVRPYGFAGTTKDGDLILPNCESVSSDGFTSFSANSVSLPNCTQVSSNAFRFMHNVLRVDIPKIQYISSYCFGYSENLREVNSPMITRVNDYSFQGCTSLQKVTTQNVQTFGDYAFDNCTNLESVDTSSGVYFYRYCFSNCKKIDSLDFSSAYDIYYQAFQNCTGLRKIWLPSSVYRIRHSGSNYPFFGVNPNCLIYTNVENESSVPSAWSQYWNNYSTSSKLNVFYGSTYEDFVNETLPTFPYNFTITAPSDCVVKITYYGMEKITNSITMQEGTTATYTVEKEGCVPISGSVTMETSDVLVTITSEQMVPIPSTLDISYENASTGDNAKILASLVDNYNFELNSKDLCLTNGSKTCGVDAAIESHGFIIVRPNFESVLTIDAAINSENGYDYGGVYVDTKVYEPSWQEVRNAQNYGTGTYLMRVCGNVQRSNYTMTLHKDTTYYLNFFYVKDSYLTMPDKVYFYNINLEKEAEIDIFEQIISNSQITSVDNSDITSVPSYTFCGCSYIQSINLPNVTTCGDNSFSQCSRLSNVNVVNLTEAPYYCLSDNHTLQSLDLPNVTRIRPSAFQDCENLRKIWLSNKCLIIDETQGWDSPFYNDKKLTLYTDLTSAPVGWGLNWNVVDSNSNTINVVWGATHEEFENA